MIFRDGLWLPTPRRIIRALPSIWPGGRTREAEVHTHGVGMQGWFTVRAKDAQTGRVIREFSFPNLITNYGMNFFGAPPVANRGVYLHFGYIALGSGNTAPAFTDTTLATELGRSNTGATGDATESYVAGPPEYGQIRWIKTFGSAVANGTIREIGVFDAAAAGNMLCRALLLDANGNPTEFVKTSGMTIDVIYDFRWYVPQADVDYAAVNIGGSNYDLKIRPINVSDAQGWRYAARWGTFQAPGTTYSLLFNAFIHSAVSGIVAKTTSTGATSSSAAQNTAAAYVSGNFYADHTSIWTAAQGALTFGRIVFCDRTDSGTLRGLFQMQFTPALAKSGVQQLALNFRTSWARV